MAKCHGQMPERHIRRSGGQYPLLVSWKVALGKGNQGGVPTSRVTGPAEREVLCSSQGRMTTGPLCYKPPVLGLRFVALGLGAHCLPCLVPLLKTPENCACPGLCNRTTNHSLTVEAASHPSWGQTSKLRGWTTVPSGDAEMSPSSSLLVSGATSHSGVP